jgi:hypothetical protein
MVIMKGPAGAFDLFEDASALAVQIKGLGLLFVARFTNPQYRI